MSDLDKKPKEEISELKVEKPSKKKASKKVKKELKTPKPAETPKSLKVAEGKSITSKRGIKIAGDVVDASYFANGEETVKSLLAKKYLEIC